MPWAKLIASVAYDLSLKLFKSAILVMRHNTCIHLADKHQATYILTEQCWGWLVWMEQICQGVGIELSCLPLPSSKNIWKINNFLLIEETPVSYFNEICGFNLFYYTSVVAWYYCKFSYDKDFMQLMFHLPWWQHTCQVS